MRRNLFYFFNIIVPLLLGTAIYLYWRPDAYISKLIFELLNISPGLEPGRPVGIFRFVRYYLCDMFWAYALIFSLAFYLGRNRLRSAYIIGLCFTTFLEFLQLLPQMPGSFDILDIIVEFIICTITIHLIYFYERRRNVL